MEKQVGPFLLVIKPVGEIAGTYIFNNKTKHLITRAELTTLRQLTTRQRIKAFVIR